MNQADNYTLIFGVVPICSEDCSWVSIRQKGWWVFVSLWDLSGKNLQSSSGIGKKESEREEIKWKLMEQRAN